MTELEYHYFVPLNKQMDLGLESKATSITKKDTTKHFYMHFLMEGQT